MRYIRGMRTLPLVLSANGSDILKWWVDASFSVHPNIQGHSGGGLSLGCGFPILSSTKQKLNIRSSTATEIVGADEFMKEICWTRYFMKAQGYRVLDNVLFQGIGSSINMEKNGKSSSRESTKHMNIWYFVITYRVTEGNMSLVWCPTGDIIWDFMTNTLQGALFHKFRDQIIAVIPAQDPGPGKSQPWKTHPGKGKPRKGKEYIFLSLVLPVGQHHMIALGEVKNGRWTGIRTCDLLETHINATVICWVDGCIGSWTAILWDDGYIINYCNKNSISCT